MGEGNGREKFREKEKKNSWNDSDESNRMIDLWSTGEWMFHDFVLHSQWLSHSSVLSIHSAIYAIYGAIDFVSHRACVCCAVWMSTQSRRIFAILLWAPMMMVLNGFEHNVWAANKNSWQKIVLRAINVCRRFSFGQVNSGASLKFAIIVHVAATREHDTRHLIASTDYALLDCVATIEEKKLYVFFVLRFHRMSATCLSIHTITNRRNGESTPEIPRHFTHTCAERMKDESALCLTKDFSTGFWCRAFPFTHIHQMGSSVT